LTYALVAMAALCLAIGICQFTRRYTRTLADRQG
jgi:hypothetical protein